MVLLVLEHTSTSTPKLRSAVRCPKKVLTTELATLRRGGKQLRTDGETGAKVARQHPIAQRRNEAIGDVVSLTLET